jgi:hypothetical protein
MFPGSPPVGQQPVFTPPAAPQPPAVAGVTIAVAQFDYSAQLADELSFTVGQQIEVLSKNSDGWWIGKIGTKQGTFPGSYVKEMQGTPQPPPPAPGTKLV